MPRRDGRSAKIPWTVFSHSFVLENNLSVDREHSLFHVKQKRVRLPTPRPADLKGVGNEDRYEALFRTI